MAILPTEHSFLTAGQKDDDDDDDRTKNQQKVDNNSSSSYWSYSSIGTIVVVVVGLVTLSFLSAGGTTTTTTTPYASYYGSAAAEADIDVFHSNSNTIGESVGIIPKLKHGIHKLHHKVRWYVRGNSGTTGAAYTMSNNDVENKLLIFARNADSDGKVGFSHSVSMRGRGTSLGGAVDPLTSQDPIIVDATGSCIIGVNAGSHSVATFQINDKNDPTDVSFVKTYESGGFFPVSVVSDTHGFIYVLHAGENGAIGSFYLHTDDCTMTPFDYSFQGLHSLTGQETGLVGDADDAKPTQGYVMNSI